MTTSHLPPESDELLRRVRAGDAGLLGPLLDRYRNYLRVLAGVEIDRRLRGKLDASDLVQETFLEAHRDFARFQGTTGPELARWLRRILAHNLANAVRHYRGTQSRDVTLERDLAAGLDESSRGLDLGLAARHSSPSQQAVRREEMVRVADALRRLPEDYRQVLVLRHLEGLSFPEVARRMGRTPTSVDKLWVRALTRLRRVLGVMP
jgi:RNA polymerase sigma-70 factor (ECF subfamily)